MHSSTVEEPDGGCGETPERPRGRVKGTGGGMMVGEVVGGILKLDATVGTMGGLGAGTGSGFRSGVGLSADKDVGFGADETVGGFARFGSLRIGRGPSCCAGTRLGGGNSKAGKLDLTC